MGQIKILVERILDSLDKNMKIFDEKFLPKYHQKVVEFINILKKNTKYCRFIQIYLNIPIHFYILFQFIIVLAIN